MQQMSHHLKAEKTENDNDNENEIKKEPGVTKSESLSDRDAGFCSGEETDLDTDYHSPIDHSHDSMDTKDFIAETYPNKRKGGELSVAEDELPHEAKIIKLERCSDGAASPCSVRSCGSTASCFVKVEKSASPPCLEQCCASTELFIKVEKSASPPSSVHSCGSRPIPFGIKVEKLSSPSPFRPWSTERPSSSEYLPTRSPYMTYLSECAYQQEEPLALVVHKRRLPQDRPPLGRIRFLPSTASLTDLSVNARPHYLAPLTTVNNLRPQEEVRIPVDNEQGDTIPKSTSAVSQEESSQQEKSSQNRCVRSTSVIGVRGEAHSSQCGGAESSSSGSSRGTASVLSSHQQRNYKNMTRERRIEANARERKRVHTISDAFERLRNSIPAYANDQKLSKLSVLRVACSYIMLLSRTIGEDYSADQSAPSLAECVDNVCETIQLEGKTRKKKEDGEN